MKPLRRVDMVITTVYTNINTYKKTILLTYWHVLFKYSINISTFDEYRLMVRANQLDNVGLSEIFLKDDGIFSNYVNIRRYSSEYHRSVTQGGEWEILSKIRSNHTN